MSTPQEMWEALPPLSKTWLGLSVLATLTTELGTISISSLHFAAPLVYRDFQLWRLVSTFFYFGKPSFGFLMSLFMLARFSSSVEMDPFKTSRMGGSADYAFMLMIMGTGCLLISWYMQMPFMAHSLVFGVLYVWSKRHPEDPTSIWGFRFTGKHLPWALMAFTVLIGGSPIPDIIGVIVGHVYYFLVDAYPRMKGGPVVQTPEFLIALVHGATAQPYAAPAGATTGFQRHNWGVGRRLGD
ncbi:Derlin-1 [Hondaea fermentalgiana]|uniref:Derlin n=1 Tax=Hondaea fermentalgiana TaxID=2315210 RepID=A0A2R5GTW2_9STRA|nr:Derlin-1 [Hondaea fermentalgiana]|eukprot:GBG32083.1 Derlin-1 [Hondaea fermentalgiana]